ncbi:MAG: 30S ribosomal protein S1 [Firmicutes bacterium]|nr:30S ribosomal protein S1 [Bacillota bacterium]
MDGQDNVKNAMENDPEFNMASHEDYEKSFKRIRVGEYLIGKVVKLANEGVYVDIGYKQEGFVPVNQLTHKKIEHPSEVIQIGEDVPVVVIKTNDMEGELILSKKRAELETAWRNVTKAFNDGTTVTGTVVEHVKGGLLVDLGLRGFVPASQVDTRPVKDLSDFVGEALRLKVIELDRNRRKVVLSRKKVLEEEKVLMKDQTLDNLYEGQIVQGSIARITNFGAFVNLGGVDGLVHISELSWKRIKNPSEVVKVGMEVDVMVLKVDKKKERISLSLRQALPDPWSVAAEEFSQGQLVKGIITKIAKKYIFVELMDGVEGVIPIQEMSDKKAPKPAANLKEEQEIEVKIAEIDADSRRILLSMRTVEQEADKNDKAAYSAPVATQGATIGDILKAKMKEIGTEKKAHSPLEQVIPETKQEVKRTVIKEEIKVQAGQISTKPKAEEKPAEIAKPVTIESKPQVKQEEAPKAAPQQKPAEAPAPEAVAQRKPPAAIPGIKPVSLGQQIQKTTPPAAKPAPKEEFSTKTTAALVGESKEVWKDSINPKDTPPAKK